MIEYGGVIYYIDVEAFEKIVSSTNKPTEKVKTQDKKTVTNENGQVIGTELLESTRERGKEIDPSKYDVLRMMIEVLIDDDSNDDEDTTLGADRALGKKSLSYKIAFNTLYHYGILKEKESEE